jgi:uncharacterized protein YyaL (SSP411 family)
MKKIILVILLTLFAISAPINWQTNIDKAIEVAKKEQKNILVFINSSSCPYCEMMEDEIFNKEEDAKYLTKKYIMVKLNISNAQKIFPGTSTTPTTYIFTPNKELLASQVGYKNEEFFYYTIGNADRKLQEIKGKK